MPGSLIMVVGSRVLVHAREIHRDSILGLVRAMDLHHGCRV